MNPLKPPQNVRKQLDVHELLLAEMYRQGGQRADGYNNPLPASAGGPTSTTNPETASNTPIGIADKFIYLDSIKKLSSSIMSQGRLVFDVQQLNQGQPLSNIIEMEIVEFGIPEIARAAPADQPSYFFFQRVMISFVEMEAQAIFAENGSTRFHFELGVAPAGTANRLTKIGPPNKFIFVQPIRDLSTLTLQFLTPSYPQLKNVNFPEDIYQFNAVPLTVGGIFGGAVIRTINLHGIPIGTDVTIYVSDFVSNIGSIDLRIGAPNYMDGHLVRAVSNTDLEFRAAAITGFNFAALSNATPGTLLIGYRRIGATVRFRQLVPYETNNITPV